MCGLRVSFMKFSFHCFNFRFSARFFQRVLNSIVHQLVWWWVSFLHFYCRVLYILRGHVSFWIMFSVFFLRHGIFFFSQFFFYWMVIGSSGHLTPYLLDFQIYFLWNFGFDWDLAFWFSSLNLFVGVSVFDLDWDLLCCSCLKGKSFFFGDIPSVEFPGW